MPISVIPKHKFVNTLSVTKPMQTSPKLPCGQIYDPGDPRVLQAIMTHSHGSNDGNTQCFPGKQQGRWG